MKHTIKLLTLAFMLATILTLTGCPGPVNTIEPPVWDDGVVTTEPTCTEEGVKTYTCSNGETRTETIPALGHNFGEWSNWTTTREVAYDHDGEKEHTRTCTRCGHSETVKVTISRFVAGGYDGDDVPTENAETYRYQYKGVDDYQIIAYVYSSKEDAQNSENETVLYFSFPNDTTGFSQIVIGNNGPKITIDNLIQMKNGYVGKTVKYFAYEQQNFTTQINDYEYSGSFKYLTVLDQNSPIYIVIE